MARSNARPSCRYQRDQRIAATGTVVLLILTVGLSVWMYQKSSRRQPDSAGSAATAASAPSPHVRVQLRAWLTQSEPLINAVVIARNNIAAAAAQHDIPATGAACRTATGAVADLHRQLPSPEPTLNDSFQQVISSYGVGLPYCVGATNVRAGNGLQTAASFIARGDAAMQAALDFLEHVAGCEPHDVGVLIV